MTKKSLWTEVVQPEQRHEIFNTLTQGAERASTVIFQDVKSLRERNWRDKSQYTYGLLGTPTTRKLERKLAMIEGGEHCILTPSGLSAISLTLLALLKQGDRVLIPANDYEPASEIARFMANSFGIEWGLLRFHATPEHRIHSQYSPAVGGDAGLGFHGSGRLARTGGCCTSARGAGGHRRNMVGRPCVARF